MLLGAHQSIKGGFSKAVERAASDSCKALQIFTKAPAIWKTPPIDPDEAARFRLARAELKIGPVLVHDSYLVNPCAKSPETRRKSWRALEEEATRCDLLGAEYLVLHPGSPGDAGDEDGFALAAECVARALDAASMVHLLIETTAGQGKSIGHCFEHLAAIIERAGGDERIGVCLDTCHSFAAGYDLTSPEAAAGVFAELDAIVGADRLRALHLNDSKRPLGSRVDRHALIGQGGIGPELFRWLVNEPRFRDIPGILETPVPKGETYRNEIDFLTSVSDFS